MKKLGLALLVVLSGCAMEPSQKDIHQRVQKSLSQQNQSATKMVDNIFGMVGEKPAENNIVANALKVKFVDVKKLGSCTKTEKVFTCAVSLTTEHGITGLITETTKINFIKSDDGEWFVKE